MSLPAAIESLTNVLLSLPGVERVEAVHTPLEELNVDDLSLVPYGDLPHAALLRTHGGLRGEALGQFFVELRREPESWHTIEFLSWQVRDSARAGRRIQIRSRGLPPFIGGRIQLGTTLVFIIEFFVEGLDVDAERLLNEIAGFARSIQNSLDLYRLSWAGGTVLQSLEVVGPMNLPESIRPIFENAGWCPGRKVVPSVQRIDAPAYRIGLALLSEFEGLYVGECGPGRDCARSDIKFDPLDAEYHLSVFGVPPGGLCPLGQFCHGHQVLYIDANGALHGGDVIGTKGVYSIAPTFTDGLVNLLFGYENKAEG